MYIMYGLANRNFNPIKVSYFYLINLCLCNAQFSVPNQSVYTFHSHNSRNITNTE